MPKKKVGTLRLAFWIINLARRPQGVTLKEVADASGSTKQTAYVVADELEDLGKIRTGVRGKSTVRVLYAIDEPEQNDGDPEGSPKKKEIP